MKHKILLSLSLLFFTVLNAQALETAGLFIEPMLTYEKGDGEIDYEEPIGDSDTDLNGFGVGARVGFHILESIFIGADARYSKPTFKESGLDTDTDADAWNWGPTVGVQMPMLVGLRLWGTYILGGEVDPEKDNNVDAKFTEGEGYRLGAGLKIMMVSLNLEWQKMDYDKTSVKTDLVNFDTKNADLYNGAWILSVSFPISL